MSHAIALHNTVLDTVVSAAHTLWAAFVAKMVVSSKRAQMAQMEQAMHSMTDAQLAHIGITRSEIVDYAHMVISLHR